MNDLQYVLAVDLGHIADHTALALLERRAWRTGEYKMIPGGLRERITHEYILRSMEQIPLGYDYALLAEEIVDVCYELAPKGQILLVLDGRGPGTFGVSTIQKEYARRPEGTLIRIKAIQSTAGSGVTRTGKFWNVPTRDLVFTTWREFKAGRLILGQDAPGRDVSGLVDELDHYRAKLTAHGNVRYEADTGHDDRVDALCLGTWAWVQEPLPEHVIQIPPRKREDYFEETG